MRRYASRPLTWVIALLAVTSLSGHRLAAWDWGVFFGIRADRHAPIIEEQNAPPGRPAREQPEVLIRGPVHEAFAEPVSLQFQAGVVAPERERETYNRRRADRNLRPARTYREQESRLARMSEPQRRTSRVAQPLSVAVTDRQTPLRFKRIDTDARQELSRQATAVRTFRDDRNRWESTTKDSRTARDHRGTVTAPAERRSTIESSSDRRGTVTAPAEHSERGQPSRGVNVPEPQWVPIPVLPVVGNSGSRGTLRRGPPDRPSDEDSDEDRGRGRGRDKDKDDNDKRRNR